MKAYQKLLAFYRGVVDMFEANKEYEGGQLKEPTPTQVAKLWKEVEGNTAFYPITPAFAKDMLFNLDSGDCAFEWAKFAFSDLSPHFRDPEARLVFAKLLKCLRINTNKEYLLLFVQMKNIRLLGGRSDGPAVVTLVVDNFSSLDNLLREGSVEDSVVGEVQRIEGGEKDIRK